MINYQYRCVLTNINGTTISNIAILSTDETAPEITCVADQEVDADNTHFYTVQGTEFDPLSTSDNCGIASVMNDFNRNNFV